MKLELGDWLRLPSFLPKEAIPKEVIRSIDSSKSFLGVACSGGPDSLVLLLLLRLYWPQKKCIILHYNHRIREASSYEEEQIRLLARQLNLPLEIGYRKDAEGKSESELRCSRYSFFEKVLRFYNAPSLLLGHHQDDLFETTLMRLVRGVSLDGLIAPKAIQPMEGYLKLRPLLNFSKQQIVHACQMCGIKFFEDSTNIIDFCVRNRVRHHLIGQFDAVFTKTHWRYGFSRTCQILSDQRDFLNKVLSQKFSNCDFSSCKIERTKLDKLSATEVRFFFTKWLESHAVCEIHFSVIDLLFETLKNRKKTIVVLNKFWRIIFTPGKLFLTKNLENKETFFQYWKYGSLFFPQGYYLGKNFVPWSAVLYKKILHGDFNHKQCVFLDADLFHGPYQVRSRHPGDRYCLLGRKHEKKVKDLLSSEQKMQQIPVICDNKGTIAWIPGLPPSEQFKVTERTKLCVFLVYKNE